MVETEAEVNAALKELLILEAKVAPMLKRIGEIKEWCKEQGSFHTDKFVCVVQPRTQRRMVSMADAAHILGGEEILEELDLINYVQFLIVAVAEKLG